MSNAWILWIKVNTGVIICVTAPIPEQEGGVIVEFIFSFYIAVAAGVVVTTSSSGWTAINDR